MGTGIVETNMWLSVFEISGLPGMFVYIRSVNRSARRESWRAQRNAKGEPLARRQGNGWLRLLGLHTLQPGEGPSGDAA